MRRVGSYEVGGAIGHGGSAVVHRARHVVTGREVALKELRTGAPDPAAALRFVREAELVGRLRHPNIVEVFESFEHEGTPYMAMEYLRQGSLRPRVGRLSLAQVVGVLEGLLAALDHAEQRGIVHRDLKPENLLVSDSGAVKVADFGIAKAARTDAYTTITVTGTTLGTPQYMAPEQALARRPGPPADLYSTGVIAYELLVGFTPFFDIEEPMAVMQSHISQAVVPAHAVEPDVDPALSAWIDQLLVKEPEQRTQTAAAAWQELEWVAIGLLGTDWRAHGRLVDGVDGPLTPAPFTAADRARTVALRSTETPTPRRPLAALRHRARRRLPPQLSGAVPLIVVAGVAALAAGTVFGGDDGAGGPASTARVTDITEVGSSPDGVAVGAGAVWAVTKHDGDLRRIDPGRQKVTATVATGPKPDSVLTDGGAVYVTVQGTNSVARFETLPALRRASVQRVGGRPEALAIGEEYVWVALSAADAVQRIDRDTGRLVGRRVPVGDEPIGIDVNARRVWTANAGDGTVTLRREGPSITSIPVGSNPRDVLEAFGSAWVVLTDEDAVVRIDAQTGRRAGDPIPVGDRPHKIAATDSFLWVTNGTDDSVSQLDPRTGREVARIRVGDRPVGIAAGEGAVWVGNADDRTVSRIEP